MMWAGCGAAMAAAGGQSGSAGRKGNFLSS